MFCEVLIGGGVEKDRAGGLMGGKESHRQEERGLIHLGLQDDGSS